MDARWCTLFQHRAWPGNSAAQHDIDRPVTVKASMGVRRACGEEGKRCRAGGCKWVGWNVRTQAQRLRVVGGESEGTPHHGTYRTAKPQNKQATQTHTQTHTNTHTHTHTHTQTHATLASHSTRVPAANTCAITQQLHVPASRQRSHKKKPTQHTGFVVPTPVPNDSYHGAGLPWQRTAAPRLRLRHTAAPTPAGLTPPAHWRPHTLRACA